MDQKIYVITYFVNKKFPRKGGWESVDRNTRVVIGNLDRAKFIYHSFKDNVIRWSDLKNYLGRCVLFEAFVDENGDLSTYPRNELYISQYAMNCPQYAEEVQP